MRHVFWIFHLLANRRKEPAYAHLAHAISDECRNHSARVGVNRVSRARFDCAIWFEQPFAVANFYAHYAFLLWRSELICRCPVTRKDETIRAEPRLAPDTQYVLAVRAKFRREPLVTND